MLIEDNIDAKLSSQDVEEKDDEFTHEDRLWRDDGWTAKVIKNEDDDGWAVAMYQDGQSEPALVGPWTMGRDKKNPKPLDAAAFSTLVKTASEVLRRHEQHMHAMLHKSIDVMTDDGLVKVKLDIVADEDEPYATLSAQDRYGDELASVRVQPNFKLTATSAGNWIDSGFKSPR
ncbi:hypothetical protein [Noviherbaspirillum galbum]|nr:hypothetical protein [Noviherbaspirillum galbum]